MCFKEMKILNIYASLQVLYYPFDEEEVKSSSILIITLGTP